MNRQEMSDRCPRCGGTSIQMHWCDGGGLAHTCERCNERWGDDLPRFDKALAVVLERERTEKASVDPSAWKKRLLGGPWSGPVRIVIAR